MGQLSSRAIALQGIGYSAALVAVQGFLAVEARSARVTRFRPIVDARPLVYGSVCDAIGTSLRATITPRAPQFLPQITWTFPPAPVLAPVAPAALPQAPLPVSCYFRTPGAAAQTEVLAVSARAGGRFTMVPASAESVAAACNARAGVRMTVAGQELEAHAGEFDDVYAQIDITDENLLLLALDLVDAG